MIGVFGGMFDPIHNGHIQLAESGRKQLDLEELRFIPCHMPPHRPPPAADARHRCAMIRIALNGREGMVLDDREVRRNSASYTIDTLRELRAELGSEPPLCLLLGSDSYAQLRTWKEWQNIPKLARIAVIPRKKSQPPADTPDVNATFIDADVPPHSSEQIRAALANGAPPADALPPAVSDYIARHHLYG